MVSLTEARETPARQLWDEINSVHAGMLAHVAPRSPPATHGPISLAEEAAARARRGWRIAPKAPGDARSSARSDP